VQAGPLIPITSGKHRNYNPEPARERQGDIYTTHPGFQRREIRPTGRKRAGNPFHPSADTHKRERERGKDDRKQPKKSTAIDFIPQTHHHHSENTVVQEYHDQRDPGGIGPKRPNIRPGESPPTETRERSDPRDRERAAGDREPPQRPDGETPGRALPRGRARHGTPDRQEAAGCFLKTKPRPITPATPSCQTQGGARPTHSPRHKTMTTPQRRLSIMRIIRPWQPGTRSASYNAQSLWPLGEAPSRGLRGRQVSAGGCMPAAQPP
jgi:hypothetical protein